jgi:hypothetical protein
LVLRYRIILLAALFACAAAPISNSQLFESDRKYMSAQDDAQSGASGNFNFNQQGGVTNQTYINQAQPPRLKSGSCERSALPNGMFKWTCTFTIDYPGLVPKFTVVPRGLDVESVDMLPIGGPMATMINYMTGKLRDGRAFASVGNAGGVYQVVVVRLDDNPPIVDYSFK